MKINFTKNNRKDTFYSILPVNWLLRITCLSNIYRKGDQLAESGSITILVIYVTGFGFFNIYYMFEKIRNSMIKKQGNLFTFYNIFKITYWFSYLEYIIDIIIVYKCGRVELLAYFKNFDVIDSIVGIPRFDKIRKSFIYNFVFGITTCIIVSVLSYVAWASVYGWLFPIMYAMDHVYFFFNMLTILDVISHIIQVEYRLKNMRYLLQVRNTKFTHDHLLSYV